MTNVIVFYLIPIICLVAGYVLGLLQKGINISHHHYEKLNTPPPKNEKYNESLADLLPPEVQNYYNTTNGQNRF